MASSMTVTATQGGATGPGMLLRVKVLTGAANAASQTGATFTAAGALSGNITTTIAGSIVYGALTGEPPSYTAEPLCTLIDNYFDSGNTEQYGSFRTTSPTGTPGSTLVGSSTGAVLFADIAALEILPNGTIAEDGSAPAVVTDNTLTALTTASFTPPDGSLLVVLIGTDGAANFSTVTTMAVTDTGGGLTWTELAHAASSATCYAGVWIAQVPAATAVSSVPFTLIPPGRLSPMALQFIPQPFPSYQTSSNVNQVALAALVAGSGSVRSLAGKILASLAVVTSLVSRSLGKMIADVITLTASPRRSLATGISATATATASALRGISRVIAAQLAVTASVLAQKTKLISLAAQVVTSGTLSTRTGKVLSAATVTAATVSRALSRVLLTVITAVVSTGITKVKLLSLSAITALTETLARSPGMRMITEAVATGNFSSRTGKIIQGTVTTAATLLRSSSRALAAVLTITASISAIKAKLVTLTAAAAIYATSGMRTSRTLTALTAVTSAVTSRIAKILLAVAAVTTTLSKTPGKALSAIVTFSATVSTVKAKTVALIAAAAATASQGVSTSRVLLAQVQVIPSVIRKMTQALASAVTAIATSLRTRAVFLSAVLSGTGSVIAAVVRPVGLIIFKLGVPVFRWVSGTIAKNWKSP